MKRPIAYALLLGAALVMLTALKADEPAKTGAQPLVVIDSGGKEHKLTTWKFAADTRRLNWLAPKDKPTEGPEALQVRELDSTTLADGIVTLVPLDRLRALEYDAKKETVKLTAATGPKDTDTVTMTGSTGYKNTNRPTIEGTEDKGTEKLTFLCGVDKGIKSAKFPATKVETLPAGRPALLTTKRIETDSPTEHKMGDFQPLYRFADGSEVLSPTLYCKTGKFEMSKLTKVTRSAGLEGSTVWILSFPKGDDQTLTLDPAPKLDGKEAMLVGFVGRIAVGYKLFPTALIQEVEFDVK